MIKRTIVVAAALSMLVLSVFGASAAQAVTRNPEFVVNKGAVTSVLNLKNALKTSIWKLLGGNIKTNKIECTTWHFLAGSILPLGHTHFHITFLGCTANLSGFNCGKATSANGGTNTGVIGPILLLDQLVWKKGSAGIVALDLVLNPIEVGKTTEGVSIKFENSSCLGVTVKGNVLAETWIAGIVSTAGQEATQGELNFPSPNIKEYEVWNGTALELKSTTLKTEGFISEPAEEVGLANELELTSGLTWGWQ